MFGVHSSVISRDNPLDITRRNILALNYLKPLKELMMPACAASKTIADQATIRNLFLPLPDTDFREHLAEVDDLAQFAPEIITAITADLDLHARQKKSLRLADRKFHESKTRDIPRGTCVLSVVENRVFGCPCGYPGN